METIEIPIERITADKSWNVRKYLGDDSDGGPDEHGFSDLMASLEKGQDTAIVVRPAQAANEFAAMLETLQELDNQKEKSYSLVAGFRRHEGARRLFEAGKQITGNKPGHLRAEVRVGMTDLQARCYNGRENTGRESLNMGDKAYLIACLAKEGLSDADIAHELALSFGYVGELHRLYKGTCELSYHYPDGKEVSVFEHWRDAPGKVPYAVMCDFASIRVNHSVKELKYLELLKGIETSEVAKEKGVGKRNEVTSATSFGALLGRLVKAGLIELKSDDWSSLLKVGKHLDLEKMNEELGMQAIKGARVGFDRYK